MRLHKRTIASLAEMICGGAGLGGYQHANFTYRSSSHLTRFFESCELPYSHDGSTRTWWVENVLTQLNEQPNPDPALPSQALIIVIQELLDPTYFASLNRDAAIADLSAVLKRDALAIYLDETGRAQLRAVSGATTANTAPKRVWTLQEQLARTQLAQYLDHASEDDFTEQVLGPLFRQLGFIRIAISGHTDKSLEFGKDPWMKYRLPIGTWLYFACQIKRDKINAAGAGGGNNVATVLHQTRMMMDHPIFDPDTNRKVLLDHAIIIASGEITKAARHFLVENLDASQRRHIIFMDRTDLLDLTVDVSLRMPSTTPST